MKKQLNENTLGNQVYNFLLKEVYDQLEVTILGCFTQIKQKKRIIICQNVLFQLYF